MVTATKAESPHESVAERQPASRRSMNEPGCTTIRAVLARVGDKWSVFVITLLGERTMRFTELQRSIEGISQRMLTLTLRQLERDVGLRVRRLRVVVEGGVGGGDEHRVPEGDHLGFDEDKRELLDGSRAADGAAAVRDEGGRLVAEGPANEDAVDRVLQDT